MNIAIILSGGVGSRMGLNIPKQYVMVDEHPIISYCVETFSKIESISTIVIGAADQWIPFIKEHFTKLNIRKPVHYSLSGETRQHSIYNALKYIEENNVCSKEDAIIIHDAARPLVSVELINRCFDGLMDSDGVLPVIPVKDTLYQSKDGEHITSLLNRSELFAGQAPEAFRFGQYKSLHDQMSYENICKINGSTEIAYKHGLKVKLVKGDEMNFKITTPEDLSNFENIIKNHESI